MRNYLPLPAAQLPRNALIDMSGLSDGIGAMGNRNRYDETVKRQGEQQTYERGRDAKQDARVAEGDLRAKIKGLGEGAAAVDRLQDPNQRTAAWNRLIATHPDRANLPPEYLDPMRGPAMVAAEAGQWRDPREDKLMDLKIRGAEADIAKTYADAKDGGSAYGKTGTVVQGPDGNYYAVRYRSDGTETINPLQVGGQTVTPDRGTEVIGDILANKTTGAEIRNVGGNIAAGKRQEVVGREQGERQANAPKAAAALVAMDAKSDIVLDTARRARQLVSDTTTGLPGTLLSAIPGTQARNLSALVDTLKANAGFNELQTMRDNSPTGGALGQVAVQELQMLQATITSLEQAQTADQLTQAIDNFASFVAASKQRRRAAYEATYGAAQSQPAPGAPEGDGWTEVSPGVRIREKK